MVNDTGQRKSAKATQMVESDNTKEKKNSEIKEWTRSKWIPNMNPNVVWDTLWIPHNLNTQMRRRWRHTLQQPKPQQQQNEAKNKKNRCEYVGKEDMCP